MLGRVRMISWASLNFSVFSVCFALVTAVSLITLRSGGWYPSSFKDFTPFPSFPSLYPSRLSADTSHTPPEDVHSATTLDPSSAPLSALNPDGVFGLTPVVVGPRKLEPQYHGRGCNSSQLLASISRARLKENGSSRTINMTDMGPIFDIDGFSFSFDLDDTCPPLHKYTPEEACDLLQAFGGLMLAGDSLMRHVVNAVFIVLTGRTDGALNKDKEQCRGEKIFIDYPAQCRMQTIKNSLMSPEPICGGQVYVHMWEAWQLDTQTARHTILDELLEIVPASKRVLSPVFIENFGLHFGPSEQKAILAYIKPFTSRWQEAFPRPIGLWAAIHAPGANKLDKYAATQGSVAVKRFNTAIQRSLDVLASGEMIEKEGVMKQIDWYDATDGAASYDGTHYSFQVNIEKTMMILNVLDTVWGEVRNVGGLLDIDG